MEIGTIIGFVLTGINLVLTIVVFILSININRKNLQIDKKLADDNSILNIEDQVRLETRKMARDKTIELMVFVDKLFDKIRGQNDQNHSEVEKFVFFDMREKFWEVSLFLPVEVINETDKLLGKAIEAVDFWGIEKNKKYHEVLSEMSKIYVSIINLVRKLFYFDTKDLSEIVDKRLMEIISSKTQ